VLIEVPSSDSKAVIVESESGDVSGEMGAFSPGEIVAKANITLEAAIQQAGDIAALLAKSLKPVLANTVEAEFGLKFSAKAGIYIASADSECTFKIKLVWNKES